jgi:hypothetical protein
VLAVRGQAAQCHGADTGHAAQCRIVAGLGRDSQACQSSGMTCRVRELNARTRVREQLRAGARERRARVPSSGAGPARGGAQPSSEADLVRGAWSSP